MRFCRIPPDIRYSVKAHAVLRRPKVLFTGIRIFFRGKSAQFSPISAFLARAVSAASEQEKPFVISERQSRVAFVHIHSVHILRVFECDDVRSVLIQFEKIAAVFVDEREMRRGDHRVRVYLSLVRDGCIAAHFADERVFVYIKFFGDRRKKFQRIKLRLIGEFNRSDRFDRQRNILAQVGDIADLFKGFNLFFEFSPVVRRVYIIVLYLIVAVRFSAQFGVFVKRRPVRRQIFAGGFRSVAFKNFIVDQPVLKGYLRGRVTRRSRTYPSLFDKDIFDAFFVQ